MTLEEICSIWEETGKLPHGMMSEIKVLCMDHAEKELQIIDDEIQTNPYLALIRLTKLMQRLNQVLVAVPNMMGTISQLSGKMASPLNKLGKWLSAESYTISISYPMGISFSFTFPVI